MADIRLRKSQRDDCARCDDCPIRGRVQSLSPDVCPRYFGAEEVHHGGVEFASMEFVATVGPDGFIGWRGFRVHRFRRVTRVAKGQKGKGAKGQRGKGAKVQKRASVSDLEIGLGDRGENRFQRGVFRLFGCLHLKDNLNHLPI